ncbi:arsenite methyltransferase [Candidatus Bathyarchaeota archaeon]|nr:arsenite methyltransferase [Candidatus Bathyarchaeota archaeon]
MTTEDRRIKEIVKEGYARIARSNRTCCAAESTCCGSADATTDVSRLVGYSEEELTAAPEASNLGLGCGNPVALASLREGEVVLDLGSGAGFDCFLAAQKVGKRGKVIGVDMTPEMVEKANEYAIKGGYENVEFKLGEIESLPLSDNTVDVVISNCVINLSPDKAKVFKEAFRVLRPGGKIMISDTVLLKELPNTVKGSVEAYIGCLSGAIMKRDYIRLIEEAGFHQVKVVDERPFPICIYTDASAVGQDSETSDIKAGDWVASITVQGSKPS